MCWWSRLPDGAVLGVPACCCLVNLVDLAVVVRGGGADGLGVGAWFGAI